MSRLGGVRRFGVRRQHKPTLNLTRDPVHQAYSGRAPGFRDRVGDRLQKFIPLPEGDRLGSEVSRASSSSEKCNGGMGKQLRTGVQDGAMRAATSRGQLRDASI
jgi:hypothetical protein